jgi:hypothetical protein
LLLPGSDPTDGTGIRQVDNKETFSCDIAGAALHTRLYRAKRLMGFEPTTFCMASSADENDA